MSTLQIITVASGVGAVTMFFVGCYRHTFTRPMLYALVGLFALSFAASRWDFENQKNHQQHHVIDAPEVW
jgi:hypothetical protein